MTKLTDTQLVLLSAAAQRDDLIIPIGERLKGGVATAVGAKLVALGLAEECTVVGTAPFWRTDEEGQHIALVITKSGLDAIGVSDDPAEPTPPAAAAPPAASEPRVGTKQSMVIELLKREQGASIDDLVAATGWLPHTMRAALTGLRKKGFHIAKSKDDAGKTRYRIAILGGISGADTEEPAGDAIQPEAANDDH